LVVEKPELAKMEPEPAKPEPEMPKVEEPKVKKPIKSSFWVALSLDIVGAAIIVAGYSENRKIMEARDKYDARRQSGSYYDNAWEDVESNRSSRNMLYTIGGIFLASGIGVHIWF